MTSQLGCDSLVLVRLSTFKVYFPNIFTPNSDNVNDQFKPFAKQNKIVSTNMIIYDRWGSIVFQGEEWDGGNVKQGVYAFIAILEFANGDTKMFSDHVTLLR